MTDLPATAARRPGPDRRVVAAFAETARRLYVSEDLDETLARITATVVEVIPACEVASVSLLEPEGITTRAPTGPIAAHLDDVQYELGEGPCLEAATSERLFVYTPDSAHDRRWPRFSSRVAESGGVGSMMSCRLSVLADRERTLGSINMYALRPEAFSEEDQLLGLLLAAHAGVVVDAAARNAQLQRAMASRDTIGQAKGILMERHKITADEAFEQLRAGSQRLNVKLHALAARLTRTGEEPLEL
jgi:GAF domain-containing protein